MIVLTTVVMIIAGVMWSLNLSSSLEAVSFVTGALCVWMVVRENVWNFPLGLINVATFSVVFFRAGLYADAGLQVVYFIMNAIGWAMWLYGGQNRGPLVIQRSGKQELVVVGCAVVLLTFGLWSLLHQVGGAASFWDSLTTAISLAAQWLLNRKHLENWVAWIIVDAIYVPLYLAKDLYLTALLYAVFLVMAIIGLREWRRRWQEQTLRSEREV